MELEFSWQIFKKSLNIKYCEILRVGVELFHAEGQTDMTKLIVAFRNLAKAPKIPPITAKNVRYMINFFTTCFGLKTPTSGKTSYQNILSKIILLYVWSHLKSLCYKRAEKTQFVWRLATGWTARGTNPGGDEFSRTHPHRLWGLLYSGCRVFFSAVKRPGPGVKLPPQSSAEVKKIIELYLYFSSVLNGIFQWRTVPFYSTVIVFSTCWYYTLTVDLFWPKHVVRMFIIYIYRSIYIGLYI